MLLQAVDVDGSGEVDEEEFEQFWNNAPPFRYGDVEQEIYWTPRRCSTDIYEEMLHFYDIRMSYLGVETVASSNASELIRSPAMLSAVSSRTPSIFATAPSPPTVLENFDEGKNMEEEEEVRSGKEVSAENGETVEDIPQRGLNVVARDGQVADERRLLDNPPIP
jgi:hypothetical protein